MRIAGNMQTTVNKDEVLRTLKANRAEHQAIVEEARTGYLKSAKQALENKLTLLEQGKVIDLHVRLSLPEDQTEAYTTVIEMLEMSVDTTVTLTADQFRSFVQNKWDWQDSFLRNNAAYSEIASTKLL